MVRHYFSFQVRDSSSSSSSPASSFPFIDPLPPSLNLLSKLIFRLMPLPWFAWSANAQRILTTTIPARMRSSIVNLNHHLRPNSRWVLLIKNVAIRQARSSFSTSSAVFNFRFLHPWNRPLFWVCVMKAGKAQVTGDLFCNLKYIGDAPSFRWAHLILDSRSPVIRLPIHSR